jgi:small-conductance mechanosensitive channel
MRHCSAILFALVASFFLGAGPCFAQDSSPPKASSPPPTAAAVSELPPKVRELLDLMSDPQVRAWLDLTSDPQVRAWLDQRKVGNMAPTGPTSPQASVSSGDPIGLSEVMGHLARMQAHFRALIAALPNVPGDLAKAGETLRNGFERQERWRMGRLLLFFLGLGYGVEWLYRRATWRYRLRTADIRFTSAAERLRVVALRFAFQVGVVLSFATGSVGAFLALDWPPLLKDVVLGYLLAFLAVRLAAAIGRFLLAPPTRGFKDLTRLRIVPMTTPSAIFWHWRFVVLAACSAFGWIILDELSFFGITDETRQLLSYALGLVLLTVVVDAVWRAPPMMEREIEETPDERHHRHAHAMWLSIYFIVLWLLWVSGAMTLFAIAAVAIGLPGTIRITERSVNHILRPPGQEAAKAGPASVAIVCFERGLRILIIIGAVVWFGYVWRVDFGNLGVQNTLLTRALRGTITVAIVVLVADFVWNIVKAVIDTRLVVTTPDELSTDEDRRLARLRTLLPILRNVLLVLIIVIAGMMGLSALGVEIGPLIASAGVVGVAIGFGAQTLVRDVISGVFYLLDDAFRVGEYIQSGNYRGVVESFSLRSVKLRHQNGPLYTVPFGTLGAVQNQSRDWAVEKLSVGVTYDTDLDKARKIVKKVGQELAADPELAPAFLQPLKMQGVQAFGDYAIQLRMKMMIRPGDLQYVARRRALAMIKKAFDANGIKFAYPTVQLAGANLPADGDDDALRAAVAQKGLELLKSAKSGGGS